MRQQQNKQKKTKRKIHDKVMIFDSDVVISGSCSCENLALARGKKLHDNREALKQKTLSREAQKEMKDMKNRL